MQDVIVIGGGIIGALSAYELAKNGANVQLLDKYSFGGGASGNSAAMLELQLDAYRGEPFFSIAKASHDLFPLCAEELAKKTGIDIQFQRCSIMQVALTPDEAEFLKRECDRQKKMGLKATWLAPEKIHETLPNLTREHFGGVRYEEDGQVNGSLFLKAALEAVRRSGVTIKENVDDATLRRALRSGSTIVVAAGAWTDEVLASLNVHLGVTPVRGQLMVFETPEPVLPYPVYTKTGGYLTPKLDGTTLAGSTIENVGFDLSPTEEGKKTITAIVKTLMPRLLEKKFRKMTAGLRPKSPDHLPFLGRLPDHPSVIVAAGHYRNGVLLAPITAKIVGDLVLRRCPPVSIDAFSPTRFITTPPTRS